MERRNTINMRAGKKWCVKRAGLDTFILPNNFFTYIYHPIFNVCDWQVYASRDMLKFP